MKISIVIPTYEMKGFGTEYLKYNIDRILKQTFTYYEVIITDHSENDEIEKYCLGLTNDNVWYYRNTKNRGNSSANMNFGVSHVTGEIIKPIFQDDFLYSDKALEIVHKDFQKGIRWMAMGCNHSRDKKEYFRDFIPRWNDNIIHGQNTLSSPSCIAYLKSAGVAWDERLVQQMDCKFYHDMFINHGHPYIENKILVTNFCHPNQLSYLIPESTKQWESELLRWEYP